MRRFECDYATGAHPKVMEALVKTNLEACPGYGVDEHCVHAAQLIREACQAPQADVHFLVGGTQTNMTVIAAALRPHQGVISTVMGHINDHETGAVEATGHKVLPVPSEDGKLTAAQIEQLCRDHYADPSVEHKVQPGMVYISHPTELGTVYTLQELEAICEAAHKYHLPVFVDGARMAYGLAASDITLPDLARLCDVFYLGGTKAGALFGEAVVITNEALKSDFRYLIKQRGGMLAKGRLLVLLGADTLYAESRTCTLPVLMYHHFAQEGNGGTIVSEARFREQMEALKGDGFTAVTLGEVLDYVDNGAPLPEKPVLITMDDGYTSNLEIAAPILKELGFRATVFVIGVNEGRTAYLHDGKELKPPRFSYEEASEWVNKGVLDLQSHTWDMHQLASYGFSGRDGVRALPGEKREDWKQAVTEDLETFREARKGRVATELVALAYPFGYWEEAVDRWLEDAGIALTFTTEEHANRLRVGDRDSLRCLGRYNVTECYTGQALVALLGGD